MQIADRTILISGGSSGLGAACAERFVELGGKVISLDLAPPKRDPPAEETIVYVQGDVTSEEDVERAIAVGEERFGRLAGAVLCAGILHAERLLTPDGPASLEKFRRVLEVNLTGTFNVARLAARAMQQRDPEQEGERGVIVLTASIAAFDGQIGQAAYAASKGGVASLALPLARELGRFGIRVVCVAPGAFETSMMSVAPDKVRQSLIDQTPFPSRFGNPEEFAALVAHAFENRMLNGCTVRLDGGLRMGPR